MLKPSDMLRCFVLIAACAALAACARAAGPRDIEVVTDPPGASCDLWQGGAVVAKVAATPGSAHVDSIYQDITFVCRHPGFREARYVRQWAPGNVLIGGAEGRAVDKWIGLNYARPVHLSLTPSSGS